MIEDIFEMISTAGTARAKYIEAIAFAKKEAYEESKKLMKEGTECFHAAHKLHAKMLAEESQKMESEEHAGAASLILVHAEDQMMCAETFRLVAEEFIDVYKQLKKFAGA